MGDAIGAPCRKTHVVVGGMTKVSKEPRRPHGSVLHTHVVQMVTKIINAQPPTRPPSLCSSLAINPTTISATRGRCVSESSHLVECINDIGAVVLKLDAESP